MPNIKALATALGLRSVAKRGLVGMVAKRWSGVWTLLLLLDLIRFARRRRGRIIARRVLKDGEVLVVSSSVNRERK